MFLKSSRYFYQKTVEATSRSGRRFQAVKLRRLPLIAGSPSVIKSDDRLDIIAHRRYGDATRFWHIADANTALEAAELIRTPGLEINIPEQ